MASMRRDQHEHTIFSVVTEREKQPSALGFLRTKAFRMMPNAPGCIEHRAERWFVVPVVRTWQETGAAILDHYTSQL